MRFKLLKHTRLNVVAFLNELPRTQHDVSSFVVDVCAQTVRGGRHLGGVREGGGGRGQGFRAGGVMGWG